MKWTEPKKGNKESSYDHVVAETPIGRIFIEWKSWKEKDSYDISIKETGEWIGYGRTLEEAKYITRLHLTNLMENLKSYLK